MMQSGFLLYKLHSDETGDDHYKHLGKDQNEVSHRVDRKNSQCIVRQQSEGIFPCRAEGMPVHCGHDVGVPGEVLEKLFETAQATLAALEDTVGHLILAILDVVLQ